LATVLAAVIGDNVGYSIGRRSGARLFKKKDGIVFRTEYIEKAEAFYEKHGGKTIILARFLAFIRTFAPTVAGAANMPYAKFAVYNITGAVLWVPSMVFLGYFFGKTIPAEYVDLFFVGLLGLMVVASAAPAALHLWRQYRQKASESA
jgi:membrane-associated protein